MLQKNNRARSKSRERMSGGGVGGGYEGGGGRGGRGGGGRSRGDDVSPNRRRDE